MGFVDLIWLFFALSSLQPMLAQRWLVAQRVQALRDIPMPYSRPERRGGERLVRPHPGQQQD